MRGLALDEKEIRLREEEQRRQQRLSDIQAAELRQKQEQDKVLAMVRQGVDVESAFATTGRRKDVLKRWLCVQKVPASTVVACFTSHKS